MRFWPLLWLLLALHLVPQPARAHAVSNSYLELTRSGQHVSGRWRVGLRDLDAALGIDQDADGRIDDAELEQRRADVESYLLARLELSAGERLCPLRAGGVTRSGSQLSLELSTSCSGELSLRYDLFFEHDASHQGHLRVEAEPPLDHVFTSQRRSLQFGAGATGSSVWLDYLRQGVWHILIGADHLLFLLTLLIAAVLRVDTDSARHPASLRSAALGMAQLVTAFTAAHSLTLTLMALGWLALPPRWVETAIALSIVAAAVNNLWPVLTRRTWLMAFAFGLIHGLGFGGVLLELGLPRDQLLLALFGFNLGVELGQLGAVALCFPFALWLRRSERRRRVSSMYGSALVGAIGLVWSLERALDADGAAPLQGPPARPAANAARECAGLPVLADPTLQEALRAPAAGAVNETARRAFELACAGQLERSAEAYTEALAGLEVSSPARGWLLRAAAEVELARGQDAAAESLLERAQASWRERNDPGPLADTLARWGELMAQKERWADVHRLYQEARSLHEQTHNTRGLAQDLSRLGDVFVSAADPPAAQRSYEQARAAFAQLGDLTAVAAQYRNLAIVARLNGDSLEAAQHYRRALELHQQLRHPPQIAADLAALARIYAGIGDHDEAQSLYERANAIERELGRPRSLARNYNQLGNLHQLRGELTTAEQVYREALAFSEQAGDAVELANTCANLASVYRKQNQLARAREMYERSLSLFERSGAPAKVLRVRRLLASLAQPPPAAP